MRFKYILLIFIILLMGFILYLPKKITYNKNIHLKTASIKKEKNLIILKGVEFYNSKKGKVEWILKSNRAKIDKNKNLAFLDKVTFLFKKDNITLFSDKGVYNLKSKDANVFKNVQIIGDSWKIVSDNITFSNNKSKITSHSPFIFSGNNFFLKGKVLIGYIDRKKFIIKGRVNSEWLKQ